MATRSLLSEKIASLFGVDGQKAVEAVTGSIRPDNSASARLKALEDALRDDPGRYLVIFDDVDRLEPRELLLVLKLVRVAARLPSLFHLLAFDEETVLDILERSEVASGRRDRAHRYLEKIVQVRFDLPPLHSSEKLALANSLLASLFETYKIELADDQSSRLAHGFGEIDSLLVQPRAVRRFIAQLFATWPLVEGEVDFVDFFFLTFVRLFDPEIYSRLPGRKAELLSSSELSWGALSAADDSDGAQNFDEQERQPRSALGDARVKSVLGLMFPNLQTSTSYRTAVGEGSGKRLADTDYFDRYFRLGIPDTDLGDQTVKQAVADISASANESDAVCDLSLLFEKNYELALRKVHHEAVEKELGDPVQLFLYLAGQFDVSKSTGVELLRAQAFTWGAATGADLLRRAGDDGAAALTEVIQAGNLLFAAYVLTRSRADPQERETWEGSNRALIQDKIREYIASLKDRPLNEIKSHELHIMGRWSLLEDDEVIRESLWKNVDEGSWSLEELLGELVTVSIDGGPLSPPVIISLDFAYVNMRLGTARVIERLRPQFDEITTQRSFVNTIATKERKVAFAMQQAKETARLIVDGEGSGT